MCSVGFDFLLFNVLLIKSLAVSVDDTISLLVVLHHSLANSIIFMVIILQVLSMLYAVEDPMLISDAVDEIFYLFSSNL